MSGSIDLDDRIATAFSDGVQSGDVRALIVEADAASLASGEAAERARARALDPALTADGVAEARRQMEDAAFRRERLQTAVTRLQERLKEVLTQEENHRRQLAYDKAKAERDKLAAELANMYPVIEQQLADLMPRIDANDRQIEYINRELPSGAARLLLAELVARGLAGFRLDGLHDVPRITQLLRIPAFKFFPFDPYVWPRSR